MNELTPAFVRAFLRDNPFDLKSTHARLCFPILKRIHGKLAQGQRFDPIKVENELIVNGHHRYVCLRLLGLEVEQINWKKSPSARSVLWHEVEIVEMDWETAGQVKMHEEIWRFMENEVSL